MAARAGKVSAGVVLVGGRSSRMGVPKATLEWHGSTLLHRTLGVLRRVVDGPLVVVRAPNQPLPDLPPQTCVVEDPQEGQGPLQGIAAALNELTGGARMGETKIGAGVETSRVEAAFVCATDLPFLHPAFVRRVLTALTADTDVVLPVARGYPQPLAATYRIDLAPLVTELVVAGNLRPASVFRHHRCRTLWLNDEELLADSVLAALDPTLNSVLNVNSPDEYRTARRYPAPQIMVQHYGALTADVYLRAHHVRAATLAGAAEAVGLTLDRHTVIALNGDQVGPDGDIPLASGDTVTFFA